MIIQIRGTSGSGKSTVMRAVKEALGKGWLAANVSGRKQPLYYALPSRNVAILGHYESPCGGCDTIGSAPIVFELMNNLCHGRAVEHVLCEGLLLSEDTKWTLQLMNVELRVIFLTTPVEECIERIKGRREAVGNEKPLKEDNTRNRVAVIERARKKLIEAGVSCIRASSEQAPGIILKWLSEKH